jgi:uncharacterized protein YehS (DUF1456 family)
MVTKYIENLSEEEIMELSKKSRVELEDDLNAVFLAKNTAEDFVQHATEIAIKAFPYTEDATAVAVIAQTISINYLNNNLKLFFERYMEQTTKDKEP